MEEKWQTTILCRLQKVNAITKKDAYPLPHIDEMLNALTGYSWFSTLDLASGYWQVAMDPVTKRKLLLLHDTEFMNLM